MKKGTLNILGRKNQSLYDTNVKIKDMDNMQLVLAAPVIPESGTASVRARPTVKHHASSDSFQGFAVPTPKVPLLPPVSAPKVNGSVAGAKWSNGSVMSVPDVVEGDIFIPPPPSMAPPPPPETFILPPPDFMGDLNPAADLGTFQIPSVAAPSPTSQTPSVEPNLASMQPPTMAPPKPPSMSSTNAAQAPSPAPAAVPDHPRFAPPQPPVEKQQKTHKTPPPKPIRMSSIPILDSPPHTPAPPPPAQGPAVSSFNPQNRAKLYDAPKASFFKGYEDCDTKPKQMLLLEDTGSVNTPPVLIQVDEKAPKVATPPNPVPKDVEELKEDVKITQPAQPQPSKPKQDPTVETVPAQQETAQPVPTLPQTSPQNPEVNGTKTDPEPSKDKLEASQSKSRNFSPLLDQKLHNLRASERPRDGYATSPLAMLKAAKERQKQKQKHTVPQENTAKAEEQQSASTQPMAPKSSAASSLTLQERIRESLKSIEQIQPIQTSTTSSSPQISGQVASAAPAVSPAPAGGFLQPNPVEGQSSLKSPLAQPADNSEGKLPFLPPPPEFDDLDDVMVPHPSVPPPDPPVKKPTVTIPPLAPVLTPPPPASVPPSPPKPPASVPPPPPLLTPPAGVPPPPPKPPASVPPPPPLLTPPASVPPPPPKPPVSAPPPAPLPAPTASPLPQPPAPKPKTTASLKVPAPDNDVRPKNQVQAVSPAQLPSTLSASQATLLSILQKKMLEMDKKMVPAKEAETSGDDWNGPLSDEETKVPVVPKPAPQSNSSPAANKGATLDMQELKSKVSNKTQQASPVKVPTSNGPSKHPYGMTFTVRPGTKQPITPVTKGEST